MTGSGKAPVAVFAFNRADLLRRTLSSLRACVGLGDRRIVIYCDGPRHGVETDIAATKEVRAVAREWQGVSHVDIVASDHNRGLRPSIVSGVREILEQHSGVIVLEDDILVSRWFLQFMDLALERFAKVDRVWQVSGWSAPTGLRRPKSGFLRVPGCWGWATWKRAWDQYCDDSKILLEAIQAGDVSRFNIDDSYDYLTALRRNAEGVQNTWHVRWYASMFRQHAMAVYPGNSLTRNIGFDNRGTNCGADRTARRFLHQRMAWFGQVVPEASADPQESSTLARQLRYLFLWQRAVWGGSPLRTRLRLRLRGLFGSEWP